jgi:hypothetical protein
MSQLCRVNQDPDEISGLLGVIEMKGLSDINYVLCYVLSQHQIAL